MAIYRGLGYRGSVVVGYSRFGTYALARVKRGAIVLRTPAEERAASRRVPLDRLSLPPEARETLHKLGVSDVGQFLDLPSEGVARRFGPEVHRLHRLGTAQTTAWLSLALVFSLPAFLSFFLLNPWRFPEPDLQHEDNSVLFHPSS